MGTSPSSYIQVPPRIFASLAVWIGSCFVLFQAVLASFDRVMKFVRSFNDVSARWNTLLNFRGHWTLSRAYLTLKFKLFLLSWMLSLGSAGIFPIVCHVHNLIIQQAILLTRIFWSFFDETPPMFWFLPPPFLPPSESSSSSSNFFACGSVVAT